ncbi:MAG TPA: iron-siderophore ABC transporter substrate-binding protein [Gryllotalpicola sp.]
MSSPVSLTHRAITAAALITATALALAGCAGSTGSTAEESTAKPSSNTVETLYGKVTVPANPKRIVALDFPEATALADLGVKPVGIGSYTPALPAYTDFFKGIPDDTDKDGLPVPEKIAAQKPDLIILDDFTSKIEKDRPIYEKLSAIAPTVVLTWTEAAGSWQDDAEGTAQAIGKTAELKKLRDDYLAHAAEIKKTYADVLSTHSVDLVSGDASTWFLYGPTSSHGRVLAEAGSRFAAAEDQKDGFVQYSPEKYSLLQNSDIVIVEANDGIAAKPVTTSPVFANLPASKNGNVFTTPYFFPSSYQIANALLDDFENALKNAK